MLHLPTMDCRHASGAKQATSTSPCAQLLGAEAVPTTTTFSYLDHLRAPAGHYPSWLQVVGCPCTLPITPGCVPRRSLAADVSVCAVLSQRRLQLAAAAASSHRRAVVTYPMGGVLAEKRDADMAREGINLIDLHRKQCSGSTATTPLHMCLLR